MKTYSQKPAQVERSWFLIDASSAPLGRISTLAASLLIGKGKPTLTPHTDGGDHVIVTNAKKLVVTADKASKTYYRYSGYPGGLHSRTLAEQRKRDPTAIIRTAVRGMLPDNKLRRQRLARLKVYEGAEHAHMAQRPKEISVKGVSSHGL